MNYFTHVEIADKQVIYSPHTKIIVTDLNSIDISEYRSSHFIKILVQLNIYRPFEIITLCFPRIMRYIFT